VSDERGQAPANNQLVQLEDRDERQKMLSLPLTDFNRCSELLGKTGLDESGGTVVG